MEIHDPPTLKLPALKYNKKLERVIIENDPKVQIIIQSKRLLDPELYNLLLTIRSETNDIKEIIEMIRKSHRFPYPHHISRGKYFDLRYLYWEFSRIRKMKIAKQKKRKIEDNFRKKYFDLLRKFNLSLKRKLKNKSNKIQKLLDEFEQKRNIVLDIIVTHPIYLCPKCKIIICIDRFHTSTCKCGEKINTTKNVEVIPIHMFNDNVIKFIDNNMWLEHGVDYILRRKKFQTLCGVYILGHSGVEHEIDNVGDSKNENLRILCECRNKNIDTNDIFIFSGKMLDIGCGKGYMLTTFSKISKEINQLARSKNISIIDSILEKSDDKILNEIKEI